MKNIFSFILSHHLLPAKKKKAKTLETGSSRYQQQVIKKQQMWEKMLKYRGTCCQLDEMVMLNGCLQAQAISKSSNISLGNEAYYA